MMHKQIHFRRRFIWKITTLVVGAFLWIVSIINQMYISDYHSAVSVRYHEPVITRQQIDIILEDMISREDNYIPEITLWQREENIDITNEGKGNSMKISLITVAGDMSKIYPVSMLYGGYLTAEDKMGCVIDRATAYRLYGNPNVVGMKSCIHNKEYIIRGVIDEIDSNVMIIQEEEGPYKSLDDKKYSCLEMSYTDTENAKLLAERFITTNGLGTPDTYIDGYQNQKLSYMLIHIPLWFSALYILIYASRKVYSLNASPVLTLIGIVGLILLSIILIKLTNMYIYYPSSMIPNKWSDFDFFISKLKLIIFSLSRKEGMAQYYKDIILRKRMLMVIIGVVAAIITELYLVKNVIDFQ